MERAAISRSEKPPAKPASKRRSQSATSTTFVDRRPEAIAQQKLADIVDNRPSRNDTGLPGDLKSGIEAVSGVSLDAVRVHFNSPRPAKLNARAFTQGTNIHVAPGEERHLPHEAWHVVQQAQGRVRPTMQSMNEVPVNDDRGLEHEADVMGAKAAVAGRRAVPSQPWARTADSRTQQGVITNISSSTSPNAPVQRTIIDDADSSKVLLDRFNRLTERAQVIAAHIYVSEYRKNPFVVTDFDTLFDEVQKVLQAEPRLQHFIDAQDQVLTISEISAAVMDRAHTLFLPRKKNDRSELPTHSDLESNLPDFLSHYNFFDKNMLWRFTSLPSTEQVYVTHGTSHDEVVRVVAAHSGGNDKSNPNVKTLSFGRNPAALLGIAASVGGDKHVLNIIDKAEYLYGIDINSLTGKGITAHAARGRMISLFESEYVLVSTPGFPAQSLEQLATAKYENPFKGMAIGAMLTEDEQNWSLKQIVKEMGTLQPEVVKDAKKFDLNLAQRILSYAAKVKWAASTLSGPVQDKESLNPNIAVSALTEFTGRLRM